MGSRLELVALFAGCKPMNRAGEVIFSGVEVVLDTDPGLGSVT